MSVEEFESLPRRIVTELMSNARKPYGTKLVRCEDGQEITDENEAYGALITPIRTAMNQASA